MIVEVLFNEVCGLSGDSQNAEFLQAAMPEAEFVYTTLLEEPRFVHEDVDMLLMGSMEEGIQRRVLEKLRPHKARLLELVDRGVPFLATGNAGEIFLKDIHYITEGIQVSGLGFFDLQVKTDLFNRYNAKVLGTLDGIEIVGYRSQFSFWYGDNSQNYFLKCDRGEGIHKGSKLEGVRRNNLICTQILGPILPLNPLFCEYFLRLAGVDAPAPFRDAAMEAYALRLKEFKDPKMLFNV